MHLSSGARYGCFRRRNIETGNKLFACQLEQVLLPEKLHFRFTAGLPKTTE